MPLHMELPAQAPRAASGSLSSMGMHADPLEINRGGSGSLLSRHAMMQKATPWVLVCELKLDVKNNDVLLLLACTSKQQRACGF